MSAAPTVSVVMATYNGAEWIGETVRSLQAQTLADWELVAVDDGSSDGTAALLRGFGDPRIRVIELETNGGPVLARNRGFAEAGGRYVAGLDQDDIALPTRFEKQVALLDAQPEVVLVSTAVVYFEGQRVGRGNWRRGLTPGLIDWLMQVQNPLVWSSVMFRARAAQALDCFERPEMRYVEDFDFYCRIRGQGRIAQIDEVLTHYRVHRGGASRVFRGTMRHNAERLLRERHAAVLGGDAAEIAALLVRHVMGGEPVSDAATLRRLFDGIERLWAAFAASHHEPEVSVAGRELARLWWRLARVAVRSGRVPLRDVLAARPALVPLGVTRLGDLLVSGAVGSVRSVRKNMGTTDGLPSPS